MELLLKKGIGELRFGMKQKNVEALLGKPNKQFEDEDGNRIYVYNQSRLRLTFYEDEAFRLGYLISSLPEVTLLGNAILGREAAAVMSELEGKGIKGWEKEEFDLAENQFNEANWFILQSEFGTIAKVELGAVIERDEVIWAFEA